MAARAWFVKGAAVVAALVVGMPMAAWGENIGSASAIKANA